MEEPLNGYELLLFEKLQRNAELRREWDKRLGQMVSGNSCNLGEIPHHLWFLTVSLDRNKERLLDYYYKRERMKLELERKPCFNGTFLSTYLNVYQFTSLILDGIYKYGDDNTLPLEIFKCLSVTHLSLKHNYLDKIPPDIGRLANLQFLALTNNKLQNKSIPFTLTFCTKLTTLLLDNNLLDALPGFLLTMKSLRTVHRHGNHNYFKSTFMWYHEDVNERIFSLVSSIDFLPREPERLQFYAAKAMIGSKRNFYSDPGVAQVLKDYISEQYLLFNVCGHMECHTARLTTQRGYKVITFQNPFLGNSCVPFQHWACSLECARTVEIPAREAQMMTARSQDQRYEQYIMECQQMLAVQNDNMLCQCSDVDTGKSCGCVII